MLNGVCYPPKNVSWLRVTILFSWLLFTLLSLCGDSGIYIWCMLHVWLCDDSVMMYVACVATCYDVCCMCGCVVTVLWGMLHVWLCGESVMRYVVCMTACCGCVIAGCWTACSAHFVIVCFLMAVWRCMWRTESLPASFWMKWKWGPVTLF